MEIIKIIVIIIFILLLIGLLIYKIECDDYADRLKTEYKELLDELKTTIEEINILHKENEKLITENKNLKIREKIDNFFN